MVPALVRGARSSALRARRNSNTAACPDCDAAPNFGFPIFDSTGGRLRVLYFDTSTDDKYAAALACVQQQGWRACAADHASVWLDTPLTPRRAIVEAAA